MKQSRLMSSLESAVNIAVGLAVAMIANAVILPLVGFDVSLKQNAVIAAFMTAVSFARSFALRRLFEALHMRVPMSPAVKAVLAELARQKSVEGFDAAHDDGHDHGELARAGACYLLAGATMGSERLDFKTRGGRPRPRSPSPEAAAISCLWPWQWHWWKPARDGDARRDLVRGNALGLAELEKFDRRRKRKATPVAQARWPA